MSRPAWLEEASTRGFLERPGLLRSISGLAGSFLFAALLASACSSEATGEPKLTGPTPTITLGAVSPNVTATAEPQPVLPPAATAEAPPVTAAPALPVLAPAAPPAPAASLPPLLSLNRRADDLEVIMTLSPARVGPNEVNFFFNDTNGDERSIEKLVARFIFVDFAAPPLAVEMDEAHPGHAYIIDHQIRHGGRWRIELAIKRTGLRNATTTFELVIH